MKKFILLIIFIFLMIFIAILFIVNNNKLYKTNLIKEVNKNYPQEVLYVNKQGNNYIIKTIDKIVVLNEDYKEIESVEIKKIKDLNYDLVYKKNAIMYLKKETKKKKNIYTYYDIKDGREIDKLEIEG